MRPIKHSALVCTLATLAALAGCKADLCEGEAPAFQLTVTLGPKLNTAQVHRLLLDLDLAGRKKQQDLTVDQEMADGSTSVALQVGSAGNGGFTVKATVEAFDKGGRRLARDKGEFSASGDACNYFTVSLTGEGQLDSGAPEVGPPDMQLDGPRPDGPVADAVLQDQAPKPDLGPPPKDLAPSADKPQPPEDMAPPPDKALPPKDKAPPPDKALPPPDQALTPDMPQPPPDLGPAPDTGPPPPPPAAVGACSKDNWCWIG